MKTPKAPTAPDPAATSAAQTSSNLNTAIGNTALNNANEVNPYGSVNYSISGYQDVGGNKVPTYTRTVSLSPEQQKLLNQQNALGFQMNDIAGRQLTNLDGTLSKPIDAGALPDMPTYDRQHYEDALMGRLNPQIERDRAALENKLVNQGVQPGSEAYREAMALQDRGVNDARYGAILNAGNYANQEMSVAGTARERALQEQLALRNQPINEIGALMSGGQVSMPQFSPYQSGSIAPTDVSGNVWNAYNAQMNQYNAQLNNQNAMMGGLAGLGGSLLMAPMTGGGSLFGNMMMGGLK